MFWDFFISFYEACAEIMNKSERNYFHFHFKLLTKFENPLIKEKEFIRALWIKYEASLRLASEYEIRHKNMGAKIECQIVGLEIKLKLVILKKYDSRFADGIIIALC